MGVGIADCGLLFLARIFATRKREAGFRSEQDVIPGAISGLPYRPVGPDYLIEFFGVAGSGVIGMVQLRQTAICLF